MNPRVKAEWVAALRSGNYQQGRSALLSYGDRYCCLGVLCDLHAKETGDKWVDGRYQGQDALLPDAVQLWADLPDDSGGSVFIAGFAAILTTHNDLNCATFEQIADAIEAQL